MTEFHPDTRTAPLDGPADPRTEAFQGVREARRKHKPQSDALADGASVPASPAPDALHALQQRVAELTAENEALRRELAGLQAQLAG